MVSDLFARNALHCIALLCYGIHELMNGGEGEGEVDRWMSEWMNGIV